MAADADYRIKLPVFEGPLDLLLFLLRKNELDIYSIPIESVTRQYLEVIYAMKELRLEVAGEFFVMAATLMEIKSRMLLPKHQQAVDPNAGEDDLDPRWELVHQLLQYKKFKEASARLGGMAAEAQDMLGRSASAFAPDVGQARFDERPQLRATPVSGARGSGPSSGATTARTWWSTAASPSPAASTSRTNG